MTERRSPQSWLARASLAGCVLMMAIILSSAFLRLTTMGIGCEPWPACYGQLESASATSPQTAPGADRVGVKSARLLHRASAMLVAILSVLVFLLTLVPGVRSRGNVVLGSAVVLLTVLLAAVGRISATLLVPAVGMTNLLGGFSMLACFWMLYLNNREARSDRAAAPVPGRTAAAIILAVLIVQAATGALISVTYSATLCPGLWICERAPTYASSSVPQFDPFAALAVDATGKVTPSAAAADVQNIHRLSGGVTAMFIMGMGGWIVLRLRQRRLGTILLALGAAEISLGILMTTFDFPLLAALLHNALAASLLLLLVTLAWRDPGS